jgi:hypothetical protein
MNRSFMDVDFEATFITVIIIEVLSGFTLVNLLCCGFLVEIQISSGIAFVDFSEVGLLEILGIEVEIFIFFFVEAAGD